MDSGATHNFLSKHVAISLGLIISFSGRIYIRMGDDRKVWMSKQCKEVSVTLGPYYFVTIAFVYELGSVDMILGIAWSLRVMCYVTVLSKKLGNLVKLQVV